MFWWSAKRADERGVPAGRHHQQLQEEEVRGESFLNGRVHLQAREQVHQKETCRRLSASADRGREFLPANTRSLERYLHCATAWLCAPWLYWPWSTSSSQSSHRLQRGKNHKHACWISTRPVTQLILWEPRWRCRSSVNYPYWTIYNKLPICLSNYPSFDSFHASVSQPGSFV